MVVYKKINNNVVLANHNGRQVMLMGKGLGFGAHPGDEIDNTKVERTFHPEGDVTLEQMTTLTLKASAKELEAIESIVELGKSRISSGLNDNLFFTLMDHILFAIKRTKQNHVLESPLEWEIRKLYPVEYEVGQQAVKTIRKELMPEFPEQEAAFIALHFVNGQIKSGSRQDLNELTEMTNRILRIVKYRLKKDLNEESVHYHRFITHIRYYLMRAGEGAQGFTEGNEMIELAFKSYPKEKECAESIKEYLFLEKSWEISDMELMYLILHIRNLAVNS